MDYLLHLLNSSEYSFELVHDFVFDRTRSVRQDLSIQNLVNDQAIHIYEDVVQSNLYSSLTSSLYAPLGYMMINFSGRF
jgi:deoxyadenosine/deoxycytidine kinase